MLGDQGVGVIGIRGQGLGIKATGERLGVRGKGSCISGQGLEDRGDV